MSAALQFQRADVNLLLVGKEQGKNFPIKSQNDIVPHSLLSPSKLILVAARFWLSQLELEYHDMLSLFELPDAWVWGLGL